jgi:hypothetical protein
MCYKYINGKITDIFRINVKTDIVDDFIKDNQNIIEQLKQTSYVISMRLYAESIELFKLSKLPTKKDGIMYVSKFSEHIEKLLLQLLGFEIYNNQLVVDNNKLIVSNNNLQSQNDVIFRALTKLKSDMEKDYDKKEKNNKDSTDWKEERSSAITETGYFLVFIKNI